MVDPRPVPLKGPAPIGAKIYETKEGRKIL